MRLLLFLLTLLSALASAATVDPDTSLLAERANAILEHRCMVCHGCYDAPCQLKLEAHEGLTRGASKAPVYDSGRLVEASPTRLFDDAQSVQQWRELGFYSVLDESQPGGSLLRRMLELKREHPLPAEGGLPGEFDFSLDRDAQCPAPEEFDAYRQNHPLWGMPYGLPGLPGEEHEILMSWLDRGAPAVPEQAPGSLVAQQVQKWEGFLNGPEPKQQLMSRYLYEHLFLAALYFIDERGQPAWYRLVRSHTASGEPVEVIATRRPYDDPGAAPFFYRLQAMTVTPLRKIHMPYRLGDRRMQWYRELFLADGKELAELPDYSSSNPFAVFHAIPAASRYRFLLEEAQFTIMNFIKGPVCRGRVALNVIDDHFWVMFVGPASGAEQRHEDRHFLAAEAENLQLPKSKRGNVIDLLYWQRYSKRQEKYQLAKWQYIAEVLKQSGEKLNYDTLWYGDGQNDNATLTVFRHFDTASVVRGLVGDVPKTAWIIDYPLLERIHYLLVAGFDVFGDVSHQLESRLYMDFLRMEGEFNFLLMMPTEQRRQLHEFWYRGARKSVRDHIFEISVLADRPSDIRFSTDDPMREFLLNVRDRAYGAKAGRYDYRKGASDRVIDAFEELEARRGSHNSFLPQVSFLNIISEDMDEFYTVLRNAGYSNIAQLFNEEQRRLPDEDNLTIVRGFIGAYPNHFFQINEKETGAFADQILALRNQKDFERLVDRYGVRRNTSWFWRFSDKLHRRLEQESPVDWGLLDYSRYQGYYD